MRLSERIDQDRQAEETKRSSGSFAMKGVTGEIRAGYHLAGRISRWTLQGVGAADAVLTFEQCEANPAWIEVRPQRVRLAVGRGWWAWDRVTRLSATQYRLHGEPTKE